MCITVKGDVTKWIEILYKSLVTCTGLSSTEDSRPCRRPREGVRPVRVMFLTQLGPRQEVESCRWGSLPVDAHMWHKPRNRDRPSFTVQCREEDVDVEQLVLKVFLTKTFGPCATGRLQGVNRLGWCKTPCLCVAQPRRKNFLIEITLH